MKSRNENVVKNLENNLRSIFSDTNSKTYNNTFILVRPSLLTQLTRRS